MSDTREDFGRVEDGKLVCAPRILKVQVEGQDGGLSFKTLLHPSKEDYASASPPYFPVIEGEKPELQPGYEIVLDHYEERTTGSISYEDELLSPFLTKMEFVDGDLSSCNWSSQTMTLYEYIEEQYWDWDNDTWAKWMTKIEIGNQFTTIEDSTFWELTTLTDVKIPYSVTVCEEDAFYGCTGLTSIVVEGKTIDEAKKMLEGTGIPSSCQITVT